MEHHKPHTISLATAILININIMVGAGIFIYPPLMTQIAGSLGYLGWFISALIILPVVISVATIAKLFPGAGSFYSYSKEGINETAGFISGWVYVLGYSATQAIQMIALRDVFSYQFNSAFITNNPLIFNGLFFILVALLCTFNLRIIGTIQSGITIFKLLPILLFSCAAFILLPSALMGWFGTAQSGAPLQTNFDFSAITATIPLAIFGYWGFESCTHISHLIENSSKNAYRAIIVAFFVTALIYVTAHLGLLFVMGSENLATTSVTSFAEFLAIPPFLKMFLTALITAAVMAAYASAIYGELNANGFLLNAMAKEKLIFFSPLFARTNRHGQPIFAVFLQAVLAFSFASLINNKNILAATVNLGVLCAFFLTLISLFLIQLKTKRYGGLTITAISFGSCALLGFYSWQSIATPASTIPFFLILALGIGMYFTTQKLQSQNA